MRGATLCVFAPNVHRRDKIHPHVRHDTLIHVDLTQTGVHVENARETTMGVRAKCSSV